MSMHSTVSSAADETSADSADDRMACGWKANLLTFLAHTLANPQHEKARPLLGPGLFVDVGLA